MTDLTSAPIGAHGIRIPSPSVPVLAIVRGIGRFLAACARGLVALAKAYALAMELAYVRPAGISARSQQRAHEGDLEGRDPNW